MPRSIRRSGHTQTLTPGKTVRGSPGRPVFAPDPTVKAARIYALGYIAYVEIAGDRLAPVRRPRDLIVPCDPRVAIDRARGIPFNAMTETKIELQTKVRSADRSNDVGGLLRMGEEITGHVDRVDRLDKDIDTSRRGEINGLRKVGFKHSAP